MNTNVQNLILKGLALLFLTLIGLFFIYLQDLTHYLFYALYNTGIIAVAGLVFLAVAWKKLNNFKPVKIDNHKNLVLVAIGVIFLTARYYFFEIPFRAALTVVGLLLFYTGVFGSETVKQFLNQYRKEAMISIVVFLIIFTILIVTNMQFSLRVAMGL